MPLIIKVIAITAVVVVALTVQVDGARYNITPNTFIIGHIRDGFL